MREHLTFARRVSCVPRTGATDENLTTRILGLLHVAHDLVICRTAAETQMRPRSEMRTYTQGYSHDGTDKVCEVSGRANLERRDLLELEVLEVLESMDIVPMESGETEPSPAEEVELGFPDGTVEVPEDVADDENDDEDVVDDSVGEGVTIGELGELPALGV